MHRIEHTATVYIAHPKEPRRILLRWHPRFSKWLPPGGHLDKGEIPYRAAIREAKEETGLDIQLTALNPFDVDEPNACTVPQPYLCLLETVDHPPYGKHQHMDFIFLGVAKDPQRLTPETTEAKLQWFTLNEARSLSDDIIFKDVRKALENLLDPSNPSPLFDNEAPAPLV